MGKPVRVQVPLPTPEASDTPVSRGCLLVYMTLTRDQTTMRCEDGNTFGSETLSSTKWQLERRFL